MYDHSERSRKTETTTAILTENLIWGAQMDRFGSLQRLKGSIEVSRNIKKCMKQAHLGMKEQSKGWFVRKLEHSRGPLLS